MTHDLKTLIEKYPRAAKACGIDDRTSHLPFAIAVKDYANLNSIGDFAFDSVDSLMSAIESHLAAKEPKTLTEADVEAMRWTYAEGCKAFGWSVCMGQKSNFFSAVDTTQRDKAIAAHNADIDRLWAECKRLRAELEARR